MKFLKSISGAVLGMSFLLGSASAAEYKIEHSMGVATLADTPKRIVVLTNEGTEALVVLGIKPVGATNSWNGDPDFYTFIKDDLEGVVAVGKEHKINLEAIVALEPDLIIATKVRHEKIYPQLEQIAPTVVSLTIGESMLENLELYGRAVGKEAEAKQAVANYHSHVKKLHDALSEDNLNEKISIVRFMPSNVRIMQKLSFSGRILEEVGFKRTPSNDIDAFMEKTESKERIPAMDGDRIFFHKWNDDADKSAAVEKEWMDEAMWKNLSAVKAGNVHEVNDIFWNTSGGIISANKMLDSVAKVYNVSTD